MEADHLLRGEPTKQPTSPSHADGCSSPSGSILKATFEYHASKLVN